MSKKPVFTITQVINHATKIIIGLNEIEIIGVNKLKDYKKPCSYSLTLTDGTIIEIDFSKCTYTVSKPKIWDDRVSFTLD